MNEKDPTCLSPASPLRFTRMSLPDIESEPMLESRVRALLERFQLPRQVALDPNLILAHMGADKKRHGDELRLVMLERPGAPRLVPAPDRSRAVRSRTVVRRKEPGRSPGQSARRANFLPAERPAAHPVEPRGGGRCKGSGRPGWDLRCGVA